MRHFMFLALLLLTFATTACYRKGIPGPAGKDGTAPKVYSRTLTLLPHHWIYQAPHLMVGISYPFLTPGIVDSAAVLVYWQEQPGEYVLLPVTRYDATHARTLEYRKKDGMLILQWTHSDLSEPVVTDTSFFKIVVAEHTGYLSKTHAVDWSDYNTVKAHFDLKD